MTPLAGAPVAQPGPRAAVGHLPGAEIHWPGIDASPYAGQVWAG